MERQRLARQWCARDGTSMVTTRVLQLGSELDNFGYAGGASLHLPPFYPSLSTLTRVLEGTHPLDIAVGDGLEPFRASSCCRAARPARPRTRCGRRRSR